MIVIFKGLFCLRGSFSLGALAVFLLFSSCEVAAMEGSVKEVSVLLMTVEYLRLNEHLETLEAKRIPALVSEFRTLVTETGPVGHARLISHTNTKYVYLYSLSDDAGSVVGSALRRAKAIHEGFVGTEVAKLSDGTFSSGGLAISIHIGNGVLWRTRKRSCEGLHLAGPLSNAAHRLAELTPAGRTLVTKRVKMLASPSLRIELVADKPLGGVTGTTQIYEAK